MKNIEWLKEELFEKAWEENKAEYLIHLEDVYEVIDQLDEPEILSQEWISEHKHYYPVTAFNNSAKEIVDVEDLQDLLVPKQEE